MAKENKMGVMPIPKLVVTMALPLMLSLLVQSLYNIVDGIFVGRISEEAFAATSLAYPIQLLMVAVSVGTGVGVNAVVSRMVGAKRYDDANQAATTGLLLSLISCLVFVVFSGFFLDAYIRSCSGSQASLAMCRQYLRICTLFSLGVFLETLGQRLLQAVGNTFLSMVCLVIGAVTNIILDPILIFACHMGIEGAAIATVIGQWVDAAIALGLNFAVNHEVRVTFRGFRLSGKTVWSIYKVGLPTILTQAMGAIMLFSMNSILGSLLSGTAGAASAIAFFGAYYKLQNFLFMPISGLGQAAIPIVGYNFGAGNGKRIRQVLKTEIPIAIGIAAIGTLLFETLPGPLLRIFSASDEALAIGIPGLRIIAVTFVFGAVTTILGFVCSGLGSGLVSMLGTGLRQLFPLVPLVYLFGRLGGIASVWYAMWISEVLAALYAALSARRILRIKAAPLEAASKSQ